MEGIARYIYETTKRMTLNHPEVEFHFLFDRPYDKKFLFSDNVVPHILNPQSRHPLLWYLWFEKSVPGFFKKNQMDCFYSGDMYLSLNTKVPTVYVSHDLNYIHYPEGLKWSHLKYYQKFMPSFHEAADKIISVSEATKKDIIQQYGIAESKIQVAGNALPESIRKIDHIQNVVTKKNLTNGSNYFCYIGSLHPRKNVGRLIEAFERFKSTSGSDMKLVLYGRNAWKTSDIFQKYNSSKFKPDILFPDTSNYTVSEILSASTALCYVSLFEGFGIPILEAFECETAVITSKISSMPEVACEAGLLVDPKSIESISNAMLKIYENPQLRNDLIAKGKERLNLYSWDESSEKVFTALKSISKS